MDVALIVDVPIYASGLLVTFVGGIDVLVSALSHGRDGFSRRTLKLVAIG